MNKKCFGCGALLQTKDPLLDGYIKTLFTETDTVCERCFKINNYNDYKLVDKNNSDFKAVFNEINSNRDLVVLVVDIFDFNENIDIIKENVNRDFLLVVTKKDILPKSVTDQKIITYFKELDLPIIDLVIISSKNNHNFDRLYDKINRYKKTNRVYIVGFTNAGKSTLLNKFIKNYSKMNYTLTTSMLPSTTLGSLDIKISNDLVLVDTPGLLDDSSIIYYVDKEMLKKINPKNGIKPLTYQFKSDGEVTIEDFVKIVGSDKTNMTLYFSNALNIKHNHKVTDYLNDLKKYELVVPSNYDLVIGGLGFIKFTKESKITVYVLEKTGVRVRKSLI